MPLVRVSNGGTEVKEAAIFYYTGSQVSTHGLYNFETGYESHASNVTGEYIKNNGRTVTAVKSGTFGIIRGLNNNTTVATQGYYNAGDTLITISGGVTAIWCYG